MRINLKKLPALSVLLAVTFITPNAFADIETLDIQWSGALYGNSATATGFITIDNTLLPETGTSRFRCSPIPALPAWVSLLPAPPAAMAHLVSRIFTASVSPRPVLWI